MSLDQGCFQKCLVSDSVILKPHRVGRNVQDVIYAKLCSTFEGVCSRHGYILPGSIRLHRSSQGALEGANLNGDVRYDLQYHALVCNPAIGSVIAARVVNMTRFGFLLHSGAVPGGGDAIANLSSIVETVVSRQSMFTSLANAEASDDGPDLTQVIDLDKIMIGDVVSVQVIGKKFQLNDRHIFVVGRIVETTPLQSLNKEDVAVIGDNNEKDLSVIAAGEMSADERDDDETQESNSESEGSIGSDDTGSDGSSHTLSDDDKPTDPQQNEKRLKRGMSKKAVADSKSVPMKPMKSNNALKEDSSESELDESDSDGVDGDEDGADENDEEDEDADENGETEDGSSSGHVSEDDDV